MIVRRSEFDQVMGELSRHGQLSLDTETTGLRPFHSDRLFSIIIATDSESYYFNFQAYTGLEAEQVLLESHLAALKNLLSIPTICWYLHNAKFDLHMLAREGLFIAGTVHCTQAVARVEYNNHMTYSLSACAARVGLEKSDEVEKYITEHDLWEWEQIPGKQVRSKNKFYNRVPYEIITRYGEKDGRITFDLARSQEAELQKLARQSDDRPRPSILTLAANEQRLTRTLFNIEQTGVKVDLDYCRRAAEFERENQARAEAAFETHAGKPFKNSPKLFAEVFTPWKHLWQFTKKDNPSFESDVLQTFKSPLADAVLDYRAAKSKADFYHGFIYHADSQGVVHPNFNQDGAGTGRLSSSSPNFQNLTKEDDEDSLAKEFIVRRAIIPRPGFVLCSIDQDQVEYRLMIEYAGEQVLARKILEEGLDVHDATGQLLSLTRSRAKTINFGLLYGMGIAALAAALGVSLDEARRLKAEYFAKLPAIQRFVQAVTRTAQVRGYVFNWMGRRCHFPDPRFAYKAPNALIQGGCADIMKVSLNQIDEALKSYRSRMIMTIHDEVVLEVAEEELDVVPKLCVGIIEKVYPSKLLPLTAGAAFSRRSLADLGESA